MPINRKGASIHVYPYPHPDGTCTLEVRRHTRLRPNCLIHTSHYESTAAALSWACMCLSQRYPGLYIHGPGAESREEPGQD
jgi:hypothetical protein